jgi:hypothetical protein
MQSYISKPCAKKGIESKDHVVRILYVVTFPVHMVFSIFFLEERRERRKERKGELEGEVRMEGRMEARTEGGRKEGRAYERKEGRRMDKRKERRTNGRKGKGKEGRTNGRTKGRTNGRKDRKDRKGVAPRPRSIGAWRIGRARTRGFRPCPTTPTICPFGRKGGREGGRTLRRKGGRTLRREKRKQEGRYEEGKKETRL